MIFGAGNALMDIAANVSEDFIDKNNLEKGTMKLVDLDTSTRILASLKATSHDIVISAGGSVANSIAGISHLYGYEAYKTSLFCRIAPDELGENFLSETLRANTLIDKSISIDNERYDLGTSRSIIMVTPDGERTMCTYLGASALFDVSNISKDTVRNSRMGFIEGYLMDTLPSKEAIRSLLGAPGLAITLSDPNCVIRNKADFLNALPHTSMVFGNKKEFAALSGTTTEAGVSLASDLGVIAVCTRSSEPVLVMSGKESFEVPLHKVKAYDTTGAGDQFAAGTLYGVLNGLRIEEAVALGNRCAAEVIQHRGARPPLPFLWREEFEP